MQNYIIIHIANNKPKMVLQPMKEVFAMLPSFFVQTHRSYVVNGKRINKIGDNTLTLGEYTIPLSRQRKKEVTDAFFKER